jgi:hypothetical protein
MRRRDREINIFSMSALDLFASAMGAFILITIILMPYYKKQRPTPEVSVQSCPDKTPIQQCPICPDPIICPTQAPPAPKIVDKLLLVRMYWDKKADIDLHIKTEYGTFKYDKKLIVGKPGELVHDDKIGGSPQALAKEVWLNFEPSPGLYEICYHYFPDPIKGSVNVWGKLDKPSGQISLKKVRLKAKQKTCVFKFRVTHDFQIQET